MLPTPSTSHIPPTAPIYPPAEDSYLLLDSLSTPTETTFLSSRFPPSSPTALLVELGTGSGIVSAFVLQHAQPHIFCRGIMGIAVDINSHASLAAKQTIDMAVREGSGSVLLGSITADLTSSIRGGVVDVLVFNPPYVPTPTLPTLPSPTTSTTTTSPDNVDDDLLSLSCNGGIDGMEVTNRVLENLDEILSPRGVFYLLLCKRNKPLEVAERIRGMGEGWNVECVVEKRCGWEVLSIWRIWRGGT